MIGSPLEHECAISRIRVPVGFTLCYAIFGFIAFSLFCSWANRKVKFGSFCNIVAVIFILVCTELLAQVKYIACRGESGSCHFHFLEYNLFSTDASVLF